MASEREILFEFFIEFYRIHWSLLINWQFLQLIGVQHLHNADIAHNDIGMNSIAFGKETLPANRHRLRGITYNTDVYVIGKNQI